jgi:hypothetical protein
MAHHMRTDGMPYRRPASSTADRSVSHQLRDQKLAAWCEFVWSSTGIPPTTAWTVRPPAPRTASARATSAAISSREACLLALGARRLSTVSWL